MKELLVVLLSISLLQNIWSIPTRIDDFKKGTKLQLSKNKDSYRPVPWVKAPNNPSIPVNPDNMKFKTKEELKQIKCTYEEKCSTKNEVKIQVAGAKLMEARDDLHFVYYTPSVVAYCKEKKGQTPGFYMSADFSGCLMTVFEKNEERWVAHVDTSETEAGDRCKMLVQLNRGKFVKPYDGKDDASINEYLELRENLQQEVKALVGDKKFMDNGFSSYKTLYKWGLVSNDDKFYIMYVKRSLDDQRKVSQSDDPVTWTFEVVKLTQRDPKPLMEVPLKKPAKPKVDEGKKKKGGKAKPFYEEDNDRDLNEINFLFDDDDK